MLIPIFIIVHDRLQILDQAVRSYERLTTPIELVFHDVASTYSPTLEYLKKQEAAGHVVVRTEHNDHLTVYQTIRSYLNDHPDCLYYVLTDPDIELQTDEGVTDALECYRELLDRYPDITTVGPMLRIDDLPDYYPRKQNVITGHGKQYWSGPRVVEKVNERSFETVRLTKGGVGSTTFQMRRRDNVDPLHQLPSLRCLAPYWSRHLDWYLDPNHLPPCQQFYAQHCNHIAHWSNPEWKGKYYNETVATFESAESEEQEQEECEVKQTLSAPQWNSMSRYETLNTMLKITFELFAKHDIPARIMYGTLLGYRRDGKIIPNDNDADLIMMDEDFQRFIKTKADFLARGLTLFSHPSGAIVQIVPTIAKAHKVKKHKKGMIDVYRFTRRGEYVFDTWNLWSYRQEYIFPWRDITFLGHSVQTVCNPDPLLLYHYGKDWKNPNVTWFGRFDGFHFRTTNGYVQVWDRDANVHEKSTRSPHPTTPKRSI